MHEKTLTIKLSDNNYKNNSHLSTICLYVFLQFKTGTVVKTDGLLAQVGQVLDSKWQIQVTYKQKLVKLLPAHSATKWHYVIFVCCFVLFCMLFCMLYVNIH